MAILGVWGDIVFEVSLEAIRGLKELYRRATWKYAEHEVVKGKNRLQALGRQLDEVEIKAVLAHPFVKPAQELKKLKEKADEKKAYPLVIGDEYFGDFVLEELSEDWVETDSEGHPRVVEISMKLKEYY